MQKRLVRRKVLRVWLASAFVALLLLLLLLQLRRQILNLLAVCVLQAADPRPKFLLETGQIGAAT